MPDPEIPMISQPLTTEEGFVNPACMNSLADLLKGFRFTAFPTDLFDALTRIEFSENSRVTFWRGVKLGKTDWSELSLGPLRAKSEILIGSDPNTRTIVLNWLSVVGYIPAKKLDAGESEVVVEGLMCHYETTSVKDSKED